MPVCDTDDIDILSVRARNFSEAKEKFINKICKLFDLDCDPIDWDEFCSILDEETEIDYGEIKEISEFE